MRLAHAFRKNDVYQRRWLDFDGDGEYGSQKDLAAAIRADSGFGTFPIFHVSLPEHQCDYLKIVMGAYSLSQSYG